MLIPDVAFASVPCCCLLICQTSEALQRSKAVRLLALTNAIKRLSRTLYRLEDVAALSALYVSTRRFNNLAYDAMRGAKCCSLCDEIQGEECEIRENDSVRGARAIFGRERI